MVYLEYDILGTHKKIKIDSIYSTNNNDINNKNEINNKNKINNKIIKHDKKHYEYIVEMEQQIIFKKLLKILKLWNEFAEENKIEYWACAGTLLGAVRHSGFIPWDNDIDISIMLSDFKKVKMILEQYPILTCCECEQGLQLRYRNFEYPFMDIFICDYYNKDTIKYCGFLSKHGEPTWYMDFYFPNEHIYKNELYPLKKIKFEDAAIMVPNIEKNVLFRTYSTECLTRCKIVKHTDIHEISSKKHMRLRYNYLKNIYEVERCLKVPRHITFTTLQYKLSKKIEKKINYGKNSEINNLLLKTIKVIGYLCDTI